MRIFIKLSIWWLKLWCFIGLICMSKFIWDGYDRLAEVPRVDAICTTLLAFLLPAFFGCIPLAAIGLSQSDNPDDWS